MMDAVIYAVAAQAFAVVVAVALVCAGVGFLIGHFL